MRMTSEYSKLNKGDLYVAHNYESPTNDQGIVIKEMHDNIVRAFLSNDTNSQKDAFFNISRAIELNKDAFNKVSMRTSDINALLEEVRNTELFITVYGEQNFYQVNSELEELDCNNGDIVFLLSN